MNKAFFVPRKKQVLKVTGKTLHSTSKGDLSDYKPTRRELTFELSILNNSEKIMYCYSMMTTLSVLTRTKFCKKNSFFL